MYASRESGGRSRSQHSQLGRSSNDMAVFAQILPKRLADAIFVLAYCAHRFALLAG